MYKEKIFKKSVEIKIRMRIDGTNLKKQEENLWME